VKQTVLALIAGNIIAFPVRALRHQLPRYMGIFKPKTGMQLLLLGQFFRVVSLVAVTVVYYVFA
ncbi:MAG: nucleoside recognition protein, partial [bacterium]